MSRSYRKTPIVAVTGPRTSEKWDKKQWHSSLRAKEKQALKLLSIETLDNYIPLTKIDVSSLWDMHKDGKVWLGNKTCKIFINPIIREAFMLEWEEYCKKILRK